jgi:hypothetical protein
MKQGNFLTRKFYLLGLSNSVIFIYTMQAQFKEVRDIHLFAMTTEMLLKITLGEISTRPLEGKIFAFLCVIQTKGSCCVFTRYDCTDYITMTAIYGKTLCLE